MSLAVYCKKYCFIIHVLTELAAENIEDMKALEVQSDLLQSEADIFQEKSKKVRRQAWKDMMKSKLFLYIVILLFLVVIGLIVYFGIIKPNSN